MPDRPIAHGRTADVYAWEENTVLKLFHEWFDRESIEYEYRIANVVHASGVHAPAIKGLIQVADRHGLIYQRVDGPSMLDALWQKPWHILNFARLFAELHAQMHTRRFTEVVPDQSKRLQEKIQHANSLTASQIELLLKRLAHLPNGDRVCHGDFHPGNVILSHPHATAIDWIDATQGNPLADVARTSIILLGTADNQVPNLLWKWLARLFHSAYLHHYFRIRPQNQKEYYEWLPVVAGARLSENIAELETWLVNRASVLWL